MDTAIILERLTPIFRRVLNSDSLLLSEAQTLKELPHWDSLNQINVIIATEQEFHVKFQLADLDRLKTVKDIVHCVTAKHPI